MLEKTNSQFMKEKELDETKTMAMIQQNKNYQQKKKRKNDTECSKTKKRIEGRPKNENTELLEIRHPNERKNWKKL